MLVVKVILILKIFGPERNAIEGNLALKGLSATVVRNPAVDERMRYIRGFYIQFIM